MVSAADAPAIAAGACYHLLLDITILDEIKGRKAKQVQDLVMKRLTAQLSMMASRKPIPVACIDMPIGIVQEVCTMSKMQTGNIYSPVQKHMRYKDEILILTSFLKKQVQKRIGMCIVWSVRDQSWAVLC